MAGSQLSRSAGNRGADSFRYLVLILLALVSLAPIFVMVATSLKLQVDILSSDIRWFFIPTFNNYDEILNNTRFTIFLSSSLVIAIGATILTLLTGAMAAFAIARMRFPGRGLIAQATLIIRMIPPSVLAVTVVGFWIAWGIGDILPGIRASFPAGRALFLDGTQVGLMLFYTALNLPFTIWLLFGFLKQVPVELEEAAIVAGANPFQVFFRVIFPLMSSGFAVSAIFTFRIAWNEFILAFMLSNRYTKTLPVFASEFIREEGVAWGQMMAVGTLIIIPPVILTFFAAKQIIAGMTAGAVKG